MYLHRSTAPPPTPTASEKEELAPEQLVDGARGTHGLERREWCSRIATSTDARTELELIAAFEDDLECTPRGHALAMRLDVAIEGALATLDEGPARRSR